MPQSNARPTEVVIPAASLSALRRSLTEQLGPDDAAQALRHAGHAAGDAFHALLAAEGHDPGEMNEGTFWRRLSELLAGRGWGQLSHDDAHPGVGVLQSGNWAEADPDEFSSRPSCFFTTGLVANLLGRVAGQEVGVLEVECRSAGDENCRFLFGGREALQGVYDSLGRGSDLDNAIATLE